MATTDDFQFSPPRMSGAELRRARLIYNATKWGAILVFYAAIFAAFASIVKAQIFVVLNLPDWSGSGAIYVLIGAVWPLSETLAIWNLRRCGLMRALRETRVIERTVAEPEAVYLADALEKRTPRRKMQKWVWLFFFVIWAFFFGLFQFGSIGFEALWISAGYAFMATIPALIFTLVFAFVIQHPALQQLNAHEKPNASEALESILWSQVERVEETRVWNFGNDLAECQMVFCGPFGEELEKLGVPPFQADAIFAQINARLNG